MSVFAFSAFMWVKIVRPSAPENKMISRTAKNRTKTSVVLTAPKLKLRLVSAMLTLSLAFAVAFVAGGALAHELDHQLHKHEVPCALHYYAGHLDGIAATGISVALAPATITDVIARDADLLPRRPILSYTVRGPPAPFDSLS